MIDPNIPNQINAEWQARFDAAMRVKDAEKAAAIAAEQERFKAWVQVLILDRITAANGAVQRGGQTVGPSNNPWTRVPPSARLEIARDLRDVFVHIKAGTDVPKED